MSLKMAEGPIVYISYDVINDYLGQSEINVLISS